MEECPSAQPIKNQCLIKCQHFQKKLDSCGERIENIKLTNPEATCEPQFFDLHQCLDSCVRTYYNHDSSLLST